MRILFLVILLLGFCTVFAQPTVYTPGNAHSHNDYEKPSPFWEAYEQHFGSIEADIFLKDGKLIVAHDQQQLLANRTLDSLYLQPIYKSLQKNKGYIYNDSSQTLQLLVDIKTEAIPTLNKLIEQLQQYPSITNAKSLKIVISGNRPPAEQFHTYPSYIYFDGVLNTEYPADALQKIEMLSADFKDFSIWTGKGIIVEKERTNLESIINKAHSLRKKVRFWDAPDVINAWYGFMDLGVDYINTDHIADMGTFLHQLSMRQYIAPAPYTLYKPQYRNDGTTKPVKNIILLIGDGTGLAQWYAGYTINGGALNVFNMHYTGLSKTSSYDSYITDSAPGSTAFSSGEKTNNRAVGVDHTGKALPLLPDILAKRKMKTGLITSGDLTDATPADFYAHQIDRSSSNAILNDLLVAPIDIIMGEKPETKDNDLEKKLAQKFAIVTSVDDVKKDNKMPLMVAEKKAGKSVLEGRGDWSQKAFEKTIALLSQHKDGFFMMQEGAQIDHGGHDNNLPWLATELTDLDKTVGKAMQFADSNGETLVIVIADHETGGLSLTGGDYKKRYISGQFSTNDHTAIPVPVFAYGPGSQLFTGVYENTEVFRKILKALTFQAASK
ncbi:MAG: alkaline phosphatase [Agriterribacter sp.]